MPFKQISLQHTLIGNIAFRCWIFQEEYERISDWIQQTDIEIKAQKNALVSTLQEKEKQVTTVQGLSDRLDKGEEMINKFNEMAGGLLSSHLDTYVNNQLRHLNSRYQVHSIERIRKWFKILLIWFLIGMKFAGGKESGERRPVEDRHQRGTSPTVQRHAEKIAAVDRGCARNHQSQQRRWRREQQGKAPEEAPPGLHIYITEMFKLFERCAYDALESKILLVIFKLF